MSDAPKNATGRRIEIVVVSAFMVCCVLLQIAIYVLPLETEPSASMRLVEVFMIAPITGLLSTVLIALLAFARPELPKAAWRALFVVAVVTLLIQLAFIIGG